MNSGLQDKRSHPRLGERAIPGQQGRQCSEIRDRSVPADRRVNGSRQCPSAVTVDGPKSPTSSRSPPINARRSWHALRGQVRSGDLVVGSCGITCLIPLWATRIPPPLFALFALFGWPKADRRPKDSTAPRVFCLIGAEPCGCMSILQRFKDDRSLLAPWSFLDSILITS